MGCFFIMKKILLLSVLCLFSSCANIIAYEISRPIKIAEMHSESISDLTMYYYTMGNNTNPPLVFLHGILAFTEVYRKLLIELSKEYFIIGIDLPGHGRTTITDSLYNKDNMAKDVCNLLDYLNINQFYLAGHSMGGLISLLICKEYPEKVIRAVSIASLYNGDGINFNKGRYNFLTEGGLKYLDRENFIIDIFDKAYKAIDEEDKFNQTKKQLAFYGKDLYPTLTEDDLSSINIPILVVVAEKDELIKPEHTKKMSKYLKKGILFSLPNASHSTIVRSKKNVKVITDRISRFFHNDSISLLN